MSRDIDALIMDLEAIVYRRVREHEGVFIVDAATMRELRDIVDALEYQFRIKTATVLQQSPQEPKTPA